MALGGKEHSLVASSGKKTRENWTQEGGGVPEGKVILVVFLGVLLHEQFIYYIFIMLNYNN